MQLSLAVVDTIRLVGKIFIGCGFCCYFFFLLFFISQQDFFCFKWDTSFHWNEA